MGRVREYSKSQEDSRTIEKLLVAVIKIQKDIEFVKEHIETLNKEHGELVKRIEALEKKDISLGASWKTLACLGTILLTVFTVITKLLELIK